MEHLNWVEIIKEAAKSPLGITALAILVLGLVIIAISKGIPPVYKVILFIVLCGTVGFLATYAISSGRKEVAGKLPQISKFKLAPVKEFEPLNIDIGVQNADFVTIDHVLPGIHYDMISKLIVGTAPAAGKSDLKVVLANNYGSVEYPLQLEVVK